MREDRLQKQRFELKYRVSEATARSVREFLRGYLVPDEFAAGQPDFSYPVHSLYLDSEDLWLYRTTINGDKNRFKLRLRYYNEDPASPVFFEIKRRRDNSIFKQRAAVKHEAVQPILEGQWPDYSHLLQPDAKTLVQLQEFARLMHRVHATPRSRVSYRREAWMSPVDNSARVTLDRAVKCAPEFAGRISTSAAGAVQVFEQDVILELKFTDRMPAWAAELVRLFGLVQGSAAKYAEGVVAMGENRLAPHAANTANGIARGTAHPWISTESWQRP
jgi:hypothetical protein